MVPDMRAFCSDHRKPDRGGHDALTVDLGRGPATVDSVRDVEVRHPPTCLGIDEISEPGTQTVVDRWQGNVLWV